MNGYFSLPLFGYNLKSRMKNFIVWSLISLCLFILVVVLFMNFLNAGVPDLVSEMISSMQSSIYGDSSSTSVDFKDFGVNLGICMQIILIIGCVYACYLGASATSNGHGSDNDITFIYSMPVSRVCSVLTSYASQLVALFFYNIIMLLVSVAVLYSNNEFGYFGRILLAIASYMLIETVYMSLSFMFSTFMSSGSQASSVSAVTVSVTVLFGFIGSLSPFLKPLTFFSPYTYISVYSIISGGDNVFFFGIVASILLIVASLAIGSVRYDKKDFLLD